MKTTRYALALAMADLRAAGIRTVCHTYLDGRWTTCPPDGEIPQRPGFRGATLDSRAAADGRLFVGLKGERLDGRDFVGEALRAGAGCALSRTWRHGGADPVLSADPGRDCGVLLAEDPAAALAALAAAHRRRCRAHVVGITGTNGKTTTKDMLAGILSRHGRARATSGNLNNQLGVPLTLLGVDADDDCAVIEMGSSRESDIADLCRLAAPRTGVITNAGGAHLQGFGSLDTIVRTKGELLAALPPDGAAILNADSPGFDVWRESAPCRVVSWGRERGDHRWKWSPAEFGGRLELDGAPYSVPVPGVHNGANLAAAILAARACGIPEPDVEGGLAVFEASAHRGALLRIGGVLFLDDAYNANPVSMVAAARMLCEVPGDGRRIAVLGAMGELGDDSEKLHRETGISLAGTRVDLLISVGDGAKLIAEGFRQAGGEALECADHAAAAERLAAISVTGDVVLVKGSRSETMEKVTDLFGKCVNPDLGRI